ncbi:phosphatidylinositol transfer protein csr1 [Coemansia sp. RSA 2050]|nr:phosphatidylinositol transfer protein csr1 [Coemansia sp. RSA 2050]KAJ2732808.1 phosphatidylinositol transfer protein csr1 [Coemansia sp. BCRC 34962]
MVISQASVIHEYATKKLSVSGVPGHFTESEQQKIAKLWTMLLAYFEEVKDKPVKVNGEYIHTLARDWSELDARDDFENEDPAALTQRAWQFTKGESSIKRFGLGSKKAKLTREELALDRYVNETTQQYINRINGRNVALMPDNFFPSFEHPSTDTRDFRDTFWSTVSIKQHPDYWVHRYMRSAGWDVDRAFSLIKGIIEWRAAEAMDKIISEGEIHSGHDEVRLCLSQLVGRDRLGYPLMFVRVRHIMPRANEGFVFKRYLLSQFEALQTVTRRFGRITMLYDFTGFTMDNTPFTMVQFMVFLGRKVYAESSSVLILLVDSWLFTNFWNLIRPFLDANLSARIIFVKDVSEVRQFIDDDQLPKELGGKNTFGAQFKLPEEGENAKMFDLDGRKEAEAEWRRRIADFESVTKKWCGCLASAPRSAEELNNLAALRDEAGREVERAELALNKFTRSRNNFERLGFVDAEGCLKLPGDQH